MGSKQSAVDDDVSDTASVHSGASSAKSTPQRQQMVAPQAEIMGRDLSSKILLSLRCEDLVRGRNTMAVLYSRWKEDAFWTELGTTEICGQDTRWPSWDRQFEVEFKVEAVRLIRVEVYFIRKQNMIEDLMEQKFLGSCEFILTEAMMARAQDRTHGWLMKRLETHNRKRGEPLPGRLYAFAEESQGAKVEIFFKSKAANIQSTDFWKRKADAYFMVQRQEGSTDDGEVILHPVLRSEVARKTPEPRFKLLSLTAAQACGCTFSQDIMITFHDWFRLGGDKYIGECVVTFEELQKAAARGQPITMPICRRDGPRLVGMTRVRTSKSQLRSATKSSRSGSRSTSGSSSKTGSRGKASKDSRGRTGSGSPSPSKDVMGLSLFGSGRRSSSLSSSGSDDEQRRGSRGSRTGSRISVGSGSKSIGTSGTGGTHTSSGSKGSKSGLFGPVVGQFTIEEWGIVRSYSFLDYIRGGLELRMNVAIDFTRSNLGQNNPASFHSMVHKEEDTAYATAIRALGEVIMTYDSDGMYPVYGFGAKIPPSHSVCSNCFALTGDFFQPEVEGVEGILKAYRRALAVCHLHGPTYLSEVIRLCANLARPYMQTQPQGMFEQLPDQKYFVMLVLTDGEIEDHEEVIHEMKQCQDLPLSIVIIGIGNKDFTFLRELVRDIDLILPQEDKKKNAEQGSTLKRRLVHFVAFNDYREAPEKLAAATLSGLPQEVVGYFSSQGVKPRGLSKFEDNAGNALPKFIPKEPPTAQPIVKNLKPMSDPNSPASSRAGTSSKSRKGTNLAGNTKSPGGTKSPGTKSGASPGSSRSGSNSTEASRPLMLSGADDDTESEADYQDFLEEDAFLEEEERLRKEKKERIANDLPIFLKQEKERLINDGAALGYERSVILRVIRDGVPSSGLDVLVDNILNGGYGKNPSYKEAAEEAVPNDEEEHPAPLLPGQPQAPASPAASTTYETDSMPQTRTASASTPARRKSIDKSEVDYSSILATLAKGKEDDKGAVASQNRRLSLLGGGRRSLLGGNEETPDSPGSPGASTFVDDPWEGVKIEDGSAARTLLEVSASRSREASKEHGGAGPYRTTSKTLEEVAGRLGRLNRHGSKDSQSGMRTSLFHTISEEQNAGDESEAVTAVGSLGPRAAGSADPFEMAKTNPEGGWVSKAKTGPPGAMSSTQ
eukprot:TRINITY_DN23632_c0_g1_i1.p1 TRINITY_DN23632_c0_g1~~TRINITY_DN23632_c0_g1_i1.p1  ORF type:complete len:1172 (+),score=217.27 TRINITY_DN23632_c0_g1_i1:111-3626(+)